MDPELKEQPGVKYLTPKMRFNLGTLSYVPVIPKKISKQPLKRKEKTKFWFLVVLIILLLAFTGLWIYSTTL